MTQERIAELRRLAEAASTFTLASGDTNRANVMAACDAIPELLDEVEALRWELVRVTPFLAIHGVRGYEPMVPRGGGDRPRP